MKRVIDPDVLAALAPIQRVPGHVRTRLLRRAVLPGWRAWSDRVESLWDLPRAQVETEFLRSADANSWEPMPFAGMAAFHLTGGPKTAGADVGIVRIEDGIRFPRHSHDGREEYLILQGIMAFDDGHREYPGDRVMNGPEVTHSYVAEGDIIVAVVLRGELLV